MKHVAVILFLIISLSPQPCLIAADELFISKNRKEKIKIAAVIDTNQVLLSDSRKIKLIGIESYGVPKRKPVQLDKDGRVIEEPEEPNLTLEEEAFLYAKRLLEGKYAKLEFDAQLFDESGNRVGYIFLEDGQLANAKLLEQGFVRFRIKLPNNKYEQEMRRAYQEAKREQRGYLNGT